MDLLQFANARHNLVSPASIRDLWERHIVDGAQLVSIAGAPGSWCDIGSGAGLPGVVIAIVTGDPMTLVEPRRLRVEFLHDVVTRLGLENVSIIAARADRVCGSFDFITARAVSSLDRLLAMTVHLSNRGTRWILPKGEKAKSELDEAQRRWQGVFQLVPSQTHPDARIVVAEKVRQKGKS